MAKNALVLIAENSLENKGEFNRSEPLEEELAVCVQAWTKHFPEIPVHVVCPSDKGLPNNIVEKATFSYHQLNLDLSHHQCGYYNIPLGLAWAEENLGLDNIAHIDLDMETLRRFELPFDGRIHVGRLNKKEAKPFHILEGVDVNFESNYICAPANLGFFRRWNQLTEEFYKELGSQDERIYPEIEEFALDYMYLFERERYPLVPHQDYQVGARYPLKNIKDPHNVKFHHAHVYESKEEYVKWKLLTR